MGPSRAQRPGRCTRTTRRLLPAALWLAALTAGGFLLLSACSPPAPTGPTVFVNPTYLDTPDCTGVEVSADPCDASYEAPTFPDLPCPTRAEVEEIQRDFKVYVNSDVSAGVLSCHARDGSVDLTIVQENIYQSLLFFRRVRFDRPLPWTSRSIYDWARNAVGNGIYIESKGNSHAALNSHAIHLAITSYTWLRRSIDDVFYGAILHEGRHAEGLPHTCGLTAEYGNTRDMSVPEMGAFGVQYLLDYWVGHHSEEPADFKQFALRRASRLRQGGGAFCCECGGLRRASAAAATTAALFQRPGRTTLTGGRTPRQCHASPSQISSGLQRLNR